MGKKINPHVFRLKQIRTWSSVWFSPRNYQGLLQQYIEIKEYLHQKMLNSFVSKINIERTNKAINITVYCARPGVVIGKGGAGIEDIRKTISRQYIKNKSIAVNINIKEVDNPNTDAMVVALGIKFDIEKRIPFRRAMKQAMAKVERNRAKGVKVEISGRLNGAEIARTEKLLSGKVPLHTLRADIDYAFTEANTIYGKIGIKVWIYKGDVFKKDLKIIAPAKTEAKEQVESKPQKNEIKKTKI